jgi:hypothetical protein
LRTEDQPGGNTGLISFNISGASCHPGRWRKTQSLISCNKPGGFLMLLSNVILIILVLFLIGALPTWPHSRNWGYYPSGSLGSILVLLIILRLLGLI